MSNSMCLQSLGDRGTEGRRAGPVQRAHIDHCHWMKDQLSSARRSTSQISKLIFTIPRAYLSKMSIFRWSISSSSQRILRNRMCETKDKPVQFCFVEKNAYKLYGLYMSMLSYIYPLGCTAAIRVVERATSLPGSGCGGTFS